MPAEPVFILIPLAIVATAATWLLARSIARISFNRAIARFERELAFPPWPPAPHELTARERALGYPPIQQDVARFPGSRPRRGRTRRPQA
jgi:hypothetical protein